MKLSLVFVDEQLQHLGVLLSCIRINQSTVWVALYPLDVLGIQFLCFVGRDTKYNIPGSSIVSCMNESISLIQIVPLFFLREQQMCFQNPNASLSMLPHYQLTSVYTQQISMYMYNELHVLQYIIHQCNTTYPYIII